MRAIFGTQGRECVLVIPRSVKSKTSASWVGLRNVANLGTSLLLLDSSMGQPATADVPEYLLLSIRQVAMSEFASGWW